MKSNYEFLQKDSRLNELFLACKDAENSLTINPLITAILTRRALEIAIKWAYVIDGELTVPYQETLAALIHDYKFKRILDYGLFNKLRYIQKLGNLAAHNTTKITREEIIIALDNLHLFLQWLTYSYSEEYIESTFNENIYATVSTYEAITKEKLELLTNLDEKDAKIAELQKENERVRIENAKRRNEKKETLPFNVDNISEYNTRKKYIDLDLKLAGWEFNNDIEEEMLLEGMPNNAGEGYADYVLTGNNGKPLAVVEAKRTCKDPRIGQQQAKLYADCIEKKHGIRPIIYYTNGFEIFMWDDTSYPPRKVSGYYTKEDLQLLVDRRNLKQNISNISVDLNITDRKYQQEAIRSFCDDLNKKQRKGLIVMATGTGKTRVAVSIVEILTRYNWAKNILFLADRTELVKQAKKQFNKLMPHLSTINLSKDKDNCEDVRMVFSTYPTMMNAIDDVKTKDNKKLFTVGHFDLIIIDEAHRSIYKKYQSIFDYFDGYLLGLTATPRGEIDRNTYKIFELEDNVPTYSYEYDEAVSEGYLVDYRNIECTTRFLSDGIKYDDLSEEEKETYEETFANDETVTETISSAALNEWVFNENTIDKVLVNLMNNGLKVSNNDKLGKTIIFAKNHKHAVAIEERFNKLYPHYCGNFARVIDIHTNYYSDLIDKFSDPNSNPQIAISVDMLDTGIDIPEVLNLVFFKQVKSKVKFLQMIGRGTRLCTDIFGVGDNKEEFYIFDICGNFEFFRTNVKGIEAPQSIGLSQYIFEIKVDIIKELQNITYLDIDTYMNYKVFLINELSDLVNQLNREKFDVKQRLLYVEKYSDIDNWANLTDVKINEIKTNLTNLIISIDNDEAAKQFDRLMLLIQMSKILNIKFDREKEKLKNIGEKLINLSNIPQIQDKISIVKNIIDDSYIRDSDIIEIESLRANLRNLMKFLPTSESNIYYVDFNDDFFIINNGTDKSSRPRQIELNNYKKKVNFYLKNHIDNPIIKKIRNNDSISKEELKELQEVLFVELGTEEEFESNYSDKSLILLVRQTVGLSKEAVVSMFSEYINDNTLNVEQMRFINLLMEYIIVNGVIDKAVLRDDPFISLGSIMEIFKDKMDVIKNIVSKIDLINKNGDFKNETSYS